MISVASKKFLNCLPLAKLAKLGLALLYLAILVGIGLFVFQKVRAEIAAADILPEFTIKHSEEESPNVERVQGETLPVWTGTERITVLILGVDERYQVEDFWHSDTMILATLDPVTMKAGLLSIPRDLWVHIPGYGEERINSANFMGDAYDHPGGGPALAVETVEYNLGLVGEIDYYVRINFQAFIELVDRVGGIEIDVPEEIDDPTYPTPNYGFEHLHIDAGVHTFYGPEALKYARTRHTSGSDFDRMYRQQQVIRAVFERFSDVEMLSKLATQAPEILTTLEDSVLIDSRLQLDEIIALANLARQVDPDDIRFRVIDDSYTLLRETPEGWQILIPLRDEIRKVRDDVFGLTGNGERLETVQAEAASISVLNGTQTPGLAYSTAEFLVANGIPVAAYNNADRQDYDTSVVILNRDKPLTAIEILSTLRLPESAIVNGSNPTAEHDIVVILGDDYDSSGATP